MKKTIVREYQLPSSCIKGKQELTIAFLTDLHDQVTGEDGERIFHLLKEQEPDLVLVGGDVIVGKKGCDTSKAFAFLKRLSDNYPVFYASGNHEQRISEHPESNSLIRPESEYSVAMETEYNCKTLRSSCNFYAETTGRS